ncbi:MAG: HEPN domain-containing protein [Candidatus Micrarchaeia archaeon]|jgi:uncharacterized protein (UPF0332 family)
MELSNLIKTKKIKKIPIDKEQITNLLSLCERDLKASEVNLKNDLLDWSFTISYNSILQAARALMYSYGYTPNNEDIHKTTLEFVEVVLGVKHKELIEILSMIRKKRHSAVYDEAGIVTIYEANYTLKKAKEFVKLIKEKIKF